MSFFALIVGIVLFFIINGRLNVIEKLLGDIKKGGVVTPVQQPTASIAVVAPVTAPVYQPVMTAAVTTAIPLTPPKPVQSVQPNESSEEKVGRTLGVVGIFAVLFGIAFFLKYAFENGLIGITGRLLLGVGVGILGVVLGRLLKTKYEAYSHILSGGGIGILFITAYTAHILYGVISAPIAYFVFGLITILSVVLSIKDGRMLMAAIGVSAGFLAPLLISFGTESFAGLFSYILIINVGVAVIAYVYRWPALYFLAFAGTLISVASWFYRVDDESSRLLFVTFVTLYFLTFLATSIFHHIIRKEKSTGGDIAFITINALWYFSIAYDILQPLYPDVMGLFTATLGVLYLVVGYLSFVSHKEDKILNISLPLLGIFFFTIAVPIQFDGASITIAWLVEALCLAIIDYKIKGTRLYKFALALYFLGIFRLFVFDSVYTGGAAEFIPVFNMRFFVYAVAIISGLLMAYVIKRAVTEVTEDTEILKPIPLFLGVVTQIITLVLFTSEIHYYYSLQSGTVALGLENTVISIVWALYAAFLTVIGFVTHAKAFRVFGLILFVLTTIRIFLSLWELGPIYRIVTSIVFGVIALAASFLYAKYKDRIKALSA